MADAFGAPSGRNITSKFPSLKPLFLYGMCAYDIGAAEIIDMYRSYDAMMAATHAAYEDIKQNGPYIGRTGPAEMFMDHSIQAKFRDWARKMAVINAAQLDWIAKNRMVMNRLCYDANSDLDKMQQLVLLQMYEQGLTLAQRNWDTQLRELVEAGRPITDVVTLDRLHDFVIETFNGAVSVRRLVALSLTDMVAFKEVTPEHLEQVLALPIVSSSVDCTAVRAMMAAMQMKRAAASQGGSGSGGSGSEDLNGLLTGLLGALQGMRQQADAAGGSKSGNNNNDNNHGPQ